MCQVLLPQQACGSVSAWDTEGAQKLSQKHLRGSLGEEEVQRGESSSDPGSLTEWWPSHGAPVSSPLRWK